MNTTTEQRRERLYAAGVWLRSTREVRGYPTAADLARALGWERQLLSNYETGKVSVPDERAEQLADALGLDIITTRAGLGLWVPDDAQPQPTRPDLTQVPLRELYAELTRRIEAEDAHVTEGDKRASGM